MSVNFEPLQIWLSQRKPLEEYSTEGIKTLFPRGFQVVVRFVKMQGNRCDLETCLYSMVECSNHAHYKLECPEEILKQICKDIHINCDLVEKNALPKLCQN